MGYNNVDIRKRHKEPHTHTHTNKHIETPTQLWVHKWCETVYEHTYTCGEMQREEGQEERKHRKERYGGTQPLGISFYIYTAVEQLFPPFFSYIIPPIVI